MDILKNDISAEEQPGRQVTMAGMARNTVTILTVRIRAARDAFLKHAAIIRRYAVSLYGGIRCTALTSVVLRVRGLVRKERIVSRAFPSGVVCVRSFFDGSIFIRVRKIRRKWIAASAALCATLALSTALVNSMFCFGLYLDGEEIGKAVNIFEVETIVASAEEQLTELLGYECSVNYALSLAAVTEAVPADIGEIEKAIITSVGGVEEKYVLTVDGEIVGAADEEEALTELLDEVLDKYTSDATASVRILSDVTIAQQYVTGDVVSDPERVKALIEPGNSDSAYSLAVENVESVLISEEIPFKTEFVEDDTLYEGESVVLCEGESGAVLFAERTVLLNGVEQSREQMGRIVAKEPVTEVVAVGTRSLTASTGSYSWPAQGIITAWFGYRQTSVGNSDHKGLDIAGQYGQSIYAADGGEVIFAGWTDGYGYFVQIRHDNGEVTCYGHNCGLLVSTGELVRQGQEIARMGSTGISTGVHCHFEIRIDGVAVDPSKYLS